MSATRKEIVIQHVEVPVIKGRAPDSVVLNFAGRSWTFPLDHRKLLYVAEAIRRCLDEIRAVSDVSPRTTREMAMRRIALIVERLNRRIP